jgi:hypothetical protein
MQGKLRLINGKELYDLNVDPEQKDDISSKYPDIAKRLREGYEVWWDKVSKQFDEEIPISIGSDKEIVTCINSQDWRGDVGDCAWNQGEIRSAKICNSYVEIYIEQDGYYNFELRRWPIEEDRNMSEGINGVLEGWFSGGVALPLIKAKIKILEYEEAKDICGNEKFITFKTYLKKGPAHLQTWLEDAQSNIRGAYYVYIAKE